MRVTVSKSDIRGTVVAPPSKSYTIRGLFCAGLAEGSSRIINPLKADDTQAAADVLRKLGVTVIEGDVAWEVLGGALCAPEGELHCRDSAATLRFLTAVCVNLSSPVHGQSASTVRQGRPAVIVQPSAFVPGTNMRVGHSGLVLLICCCANTESGCKPTRRAVCTLAARS